MTVIKKTTETKDICILVPFYMHCFFILVSKCAIHSKWFSYFFFHPLLVSIDFIDHSIADNSRKCFTLRTLVGGKLLLSSSGQGPEQN